MRFLLTVAALVLIWSTSTVYTAESAARLDADSRRQLSLLQAELRDNSLNATAVIEAMAALGPGAESALRSALLGVLRDDARAIAAAIRQAGDLGGLPAFLSEFAALRTMALDNIKILAKDETLTKAKDYHSQLLPMQQRYASLQQLRATVAIMIGRRQGLKQRYAALAEDLATRFRADAESSLEQQAIAFLGMDLTTIDHITQAQQAPVEAEQAQLWNHLRNRRIERWNESQRPLMSDGEWDNLVAVNAYREALGLRPYEIDHRLLQAARKHSKEMAELSYFSHTSPTEGSKSHTARMANAGYQGGYSENIANGARSGDMAFWMWFNSPPHHKNMMNGRSTQMGVGQWGSLWTQVFGNGKPLDQLSQQQRIEQTVPKGEILAPR